MAKDKAASRERRRQQLEHKRRLEKRLAKRSTRETQEIEAIEQTIAAGAPAPGTNPLAIEQPMPGSYAGARTFEELPMSTATKESLKHAGYTTLTAIQRAALPHALAGRDVLGAAKTGSGKTLAFLVPLLELLYRRRWTRLDGLGGLVLTPTRELAMQIFEELVKVGRRHELSAGLLIGGKSVKEEAARVAAMNVLVATPGRLLQHMDETPGFETSALQMLVLDEADRILDLGFAATLDAIIANLPRERQTLLFSATQTKSVRDLARLSLHSPEYLAAHAEAAAPTPLKLLQACMVVGLGAKADVLWSFIKTHLKARVIVFLSTCKQVRFLYEAFRRLRPGVPLKCLHGNMSQGKRLGAFQDFSTSKGGCVMFATDVAARGLDFPSVDWVVQADCPEDVAAYIHRVGRTARYMSGGRALLLLLPSERDGMLAALSESKVPLKQLRHNPAKVQPVGPALQALLSKDPDLKAFAQRAVSSYLRSVFLQPNKAVFDVAKLPITDFAASLGLPGAPRLRFLRTRPGGRGAPGGGESDGGGGGDSGGEADGLAGWQHGGSDGELAAAGGEGGGAEQQEGAAAGESRGGEGGRKRRRLEDAGERRQEAGRAGGGGDGEANGSDDELLVVKQRDVFDFSRGGGTVGNDAAPGGAAAAGEAALAAAVAAAGAQKKKKRQRINVGMVSGSRTVFDEQGVALDPLELLAASGELGVGKGGGGGGDGGIHVVADDAAARFKAAAQVLRQRDRDDKAAQAALRRTAKAERKARARAALQDDMAADGAVLGDGSDDEGASGSGDEGWGGRDGGSDGGSDDGGGAGGSDGGGSGHDAPGTVQVDPAYLGMARKSHPLPEQQQQRQQSPARQKERRRREREQEHGLVAPTTNADVAAMVLREQEALALQLLRSRDRR